MEDDAFMQGLVVKFFPAFLFFLCFFPLLCSVLFRLHAYMHTDCTGCRVLHCTTDCNCSFCIHFFVLCLCFWFFCFS